MGPLSVGPWLVLAFCWPPTCMRQEPESQEPHGGEIPPVLGRERDWRRGHSYLAAADLATFGGVECFGDVPALEPHQR